MARLSQNRVREILLSPKNTAAILRCHLQHERLRYHVQPIDSPTQISRYHRVFLAWVKSLLPEDKYLQFEKFMRLPVPTTDLTERIFTQLERALQADNQYIRVEMASPEAAADMEEYRTTIGDSAFWGDKGFQAVQAAINSVFIIDLPRTQLGERPEPVGYLLPINPANIFDVDFKDDGVADYIIFNITRNIRAVFDDEFFRIIERNEGEGWERGRFTVEAPHSTYDADTGTLVDGLGYTPACRLWDNLLAPESNTIEAKGPITKLMGRMDEWLFDYYSLRYYKSFGKWPIFWEYLTANPQHQHPLIAEATCSKGYFQLHQADAWDSSANSGVGAYVKQRPRVEPCEECRKSKLTGPGTVKRVTPPQDKTSPDNREPAGWILPDAELLKNAEERLDVDGDALVEAAVGREASRTSQPRNVDDVKDSTEVAQSMLLNVKKNVEATRRFELKTIAILRHGRANFIRETVDLGDEFFLRTENEVRADYADAKDSGLPDYLLAPIRELISETRYRNNDEQRLRQRILANLQPYPDRSDTDLQGWLNAIGGPQTLNAKLLQLRQNFMAYIMQFEREQEMSIVEFGSSVSFGTKIQVIKLRLLQYVEEDFSGDNILVPATPVATPPTTNPIPAPGPGI